MAAPEELQQFDALGSLYHEPLWVFYRGDKRVERLSQLAGKRIGVGPPGSGTHAIAMQLLAANGLIESDPKENARAVLVEENVASAATALQKGELDAAFFVAAFEADYIQRLLNDREREVVQLRSARGLSPPIPIPGPGHGARWNGEPGPEYSRP